MTTSGSRTELVRRLRDDRGDQVVLLSHCLLNENTRYLGGAARVGCVREIVDACAVAGLGMVQMPCPEEAAWGGVLKRRLLLAYGSSRWLPRPLRPVLLRAVLAYTRLLYRRLARDTARRVADYRSSGADVVAIVGVDGSPSCGVVTTLDMGRALDGLCDADPSSMTIGDVNTIVRDAIISGAGLYTEAVNDQLRRRGITVDYLAHDLLAELDGKPAAVAASLTARHKELPAARSDPKTSAEAHSTSGRRGPAT